MRDEEREDYDDLESRSAFPATVTAAGIIWGIVGVALMLLGFVGCGLLMSDGSKGISCCLGCFAIPMILVGLWFAVTGRQYVLAVPENTKLLENVSITVGILLGLVTLISGYAILRSMGPISSSWPGIVFSGGMFFIAILFLFTGWLASNGAEDYLNWRATYRPKPFAKKPFSIANPSDEPLPPILNQTENPEPPKEKRFGKGYWIGFGFSLYLLAVAIPVALLGFFGSIGMIDYLIFILSLCLIVFGTMLIRSALRS